MRSPTLPLGWGKVMVLGVVMLSIAKTALHAEARTEKCGHGTELLSKTSCKCRNGYTGTAAVPGTDVKFCYRECNLTLTNCPAHTTCMKKRIYSTKDNYTVSTRCECSKSAQMSPTGKCIAIDSTTRTTQTKVQDITITQEPGGGNTPTAHKSGTLIPVTGAPEEVSTRSPRERNRSAVAHDSTTRITQTKVQDVTITQGTGDEKTPTAHKSGTPIPVTEAPEEVSTRPSRERNSSAVVNDSPATIPGTDAPDVTSIQPSDEHNNSRENSDGLVIGLAVGIGGAVLLVCIVLTVVVVRCGNCRCHDGNAGVPTSRKCSGVTDTIYPPSAGLPDIVNERAHFRRSIKGNSHVVFHAGNLDSTLTNDTRGVYSLAGQLEDTGSLETNGVYSTPNMCVADTAAKSPVFSNGSMYDMLSKQSVVPSAASAHPTVNNTLYDTNCKLVNDRERNIQPGSTGTGRIFWTDDVRENTTYDSIRKTDIAPEDFSFLGQRKNRVNYPYDELQLPKV